MKAMYGNGYQCVRVLLKRTLKSVTMLEVTSNVVVQGPCHVSEKDLQAARLTTYVLNKLELK